MKKRLKASSRHSNHTKYRVNGAVVAVAAAVATTALTATVPGNSVAASDERAGVPDLADRVVALRQLVVERRSSVEGKTPWVDPVLSPGTPVAQWNKWKNG